MEDLESYVFYKSFHEAGKMLPIEDYGRLMYALNEFALYHQEPIDLPPILMGYFLLIKPQIEANWRRRENGFKGGRPTVATNKGKTIGFENENQRLLKQKPTVIENKTIGFENENLTITKLKPNVNVNVNVNENENENVENSPFHSLAINTDYSDEVFAVFSENGLPCCNNNALTFLQRDFKNGINYLHSKPEYATLHSDEVIQACKNYAATYKDPNSWIKNAYGFEKFVKTKNFADFLPDNFVKNNFKKYAVIEEEEEEEKKKIKPQENIFKKLKAPKKCTCGGLYAEALTSPPMMRCNSCNNIIEYDYTEKCWK